MREAFKHAKRLAAVAEASDFLTAAGVLSGAASPAGVSTGNDLPALTTRFIADMGAHRRWDRMAQNAMAA